MAAEGARLTELLAIMRRLRDPERGCPWDLEQDFASIAPYTVEEAHEVAEAIAAGDFDALPDELGDLLFQVVFHARMGEEAGRFDFDDVVEAIADKLVRRHPHVFGDEEVTDADHQSGRWEEHKRAERGERAATLDGIPASLPALARAQKIQKRAASVGFDWPHDGPVYDKIREEVDELAGAVESGDRDAVAEEFGDLLFSLVNLARHLGLDAEGALRHANAKFERRFRAVEARLQAEGRRPEDSDLAAMDALWDAVKRDER